MIPNMCYLYMLMKNLLCISPENLQEVSPGSAFRNGRLLPTRRNNIAWEVINGKGYLLIRKNIEYDLKIMEHEINQLTTQERQALNTLKYIAHYRPQPYRSRLELDN